MAKGPVSGRRIKRRTIQYAVTGVVIVALVVVAVFVSSFYFKKTGEEAQQSQVAELKKIADTIASEVTDSLSPSIEQLEKLDQKRLTELLIGGDKAAINAEAESLLKNFPTGLKLRLFKFGDYQLDREAKPPLGFASLSMLRDMEKSADNRGIEFHLANSPDAHIVIVTKIRTAEEKPIGLVHLSLDPALLLKIIEQQDMPNTYIELSQTLGGSSLALVKKGVADLRTGDPVSVAVKGTTWKVIVWGGDGAVAVADADASDIGAAGFLSKETMIVLLAVVLVLGIGGFLFIRRKQGDAATGGDVVYGGAVLAIMEGAHPGLERLVPDLPNLGQDKAIQPMSHGPLVGDDITEIKKPPAATSTNKKPSVATTSAGKAPVQTKPPATETQQPVIEKVSSEATTVEVKPSALSAEKNVETAKPAEAEAPPDMSMEFEMPASEAATKEPSAEESLEVASEEEMIMEFEMPGAEPPAEAEAAIKEPSAEESPKVASEEEMIMEFEMPGAEPPAEAEAATKEPSTEESLEVASEEEMIMEFEMPGVEAPAEAEAGTTIESADTEAPPDMNMEFELPGVEVSTEAEATLEPVATEPPPDMSMEFELPGAEASAQAEATFEPVATEPPPDMSMEFELPGAEIPAEAEATPEPAKTEVVKTPSSTEQGGLSPTIFRAYDIRGVVGETLTVEVVKAIGRAIGSEAEARGQKDIVVGRDGRTSSLELAEALTNGLRASGQNVTDIGMIPTPVLYFATHQLGTGSGVMVTGSHNGPAYNGLKIVLANETLAGDAIQALYKRIQNEDIISGKGGFKSAKVTADYIGRISEDIPVTLGGAFKMVIDCGNGVAGAVAPELFRALGHDVVELYCEVDGTFPNHHPDPCQPENLEDLIAKVKEEQADLGLAFDGDGDRLGVVDGEGNIIWPDRQMMLLAKDVVSRNQGAPIIFDVKCSRHLKTVIEENGGKPLMWKTGHSLIKAKMQEVDAPLAGELSGHIFFKERWYGFDDAIYAGARLVEILAASKKKPAEVFAELPEDVSTPEIRINLKEKHHAKFMKMIRKKMNFDNAKITDIDGVRVDFPYGWGLVRPSNTTPCLIARFEAEDEAKLQMIQSEFHDLIQSVAPDLKLPF